MTFEEYINNPLQARFGASTRELYRVSYSNRLDAILVRVNNHIDYNMYKDEKTGSYYLYIKVPSEVVKELALQKALEVFNKKTSENFPTFS